jgi:hypothetical protein
MDLVGESYDRFFDTDQGQIGVLADIYAAGDVLELRDLTVYPVGADRKAVGPQAIRSILRDVEAEIRGMGYRELRITATRLSGASPGRPVELRREL